MLPVIPALIMVFIGMVSPIPWYRIEPGWYASDTGIRVPPLAPFRAPLRLQEHTDRNHVATPILPASDVNCSHSFVIAMVFALLPTVSVIGAAGLRLPPWDILDRALHSGPW